MVCTSGPPIVTRGSRRSSPRSELLVIGSRHRRSARGPTSQMRPFTSSPMRSEAAPPAAVLTHHWLVRRRGGEMVLEALAELVPGAPIYTLVHDAAWAGTAGS